MLSHTLFQLPWRDSGDSTSYTNSESPYPEVAHIFTAAHIFRTKQWCTRLLQEGEQEVWSQNRGHLFPKWGQVCSLHGVRVGVRHPLGVAVDRGHVQSPTFVPAPSKVAIGFFWSLYLLSRICLNCTCVQNKASGGDGIPAELFKIFKDDVVKVLHSICQQIWKTEQ